MTAAMADDGDVVPLPDETLFERRMKVLTLRHANMTFSEIGNALTPKISAQTARNDYHRALRELSTINHQEIVARQRAMLVDLQGAHFATAINRTSPDRFDAAKIVLKAMEREARLTGADAPTRVLAGITDTEFANEAAALIDAIAQIDPTGLKELSNGHTIIDSTLAEDADSEAGQSATGREADRPGVVASAGVEGPAVPEWHTAYRADVEPEPDQPAPIVDDDEPWSNL